jgi:hypothetical protein
MKFFNICFWFFTMVPLSWNMATPPKLDGKPWTSANKHKMAFTHVGTLIQSVSWAHVTLIQHWTPLLDMLDTMNNQTILIQDWAGNGCTPTTRFDTLDDATRSRCTQVHIQANTTLQELKEMSARISDTQRRATSTSSGPPRRQKRFITAIISFLAAGLGIFNTFELANIKSQVTSNTEHLAIVEQAVSKLAHEQVQIVHAIQSLNMEIKYNDYKHAVTENIITALQLLQHVQTGVARVAVEVQTANNLLQAAWDGRLAPAPHQTQALEEAAHRVQLRATERGYHSLAANPEVMYRLPSDHIPDEEGVRIAVHIPLAKDTMEVFRFVPFPVASSTNQALYIKPEFPLLAISQDHSMYRELSEGQLEGCIRLGPNYICDGNNQVRTDGHNSCLWSALNQQADLVANNCDLYIRRTREEVIQLTPTTFMFYMPKAITATSVCKGPHQGHFPVALPVGTSRQELKPGCTLTTRQHQVTAEFTIRQQTQHFAFDITWEPEKFIAGEDSAVVIQQAAQAVANISVAIPLQVARAMHKASQASQQINNTGSWTHWFKMAGSSTIFTIVIALLVAAAIWWYTTKRTAKSATTPTAPAAVTPNIIVAPIVAPISTVTFQNDVVAKAPKTYCTPATTYTPSYQ